MDVEDIKLSHLAEAYNQLKHHSALCFETPVIQNMQQQLVKVIPSVKSLTFKLETMQNTGSFKARGTAYQFLSLSEEDINKKRQLITMSAGNYGKAFAYMAKKFEMPAIVFMPLTAPDDRERVIASLGATVIRCPTEQLIENVNTHQSEHKSLYLHSYDDPTLFIGHASAGLELMKQLDHKPDIVVVCCGGGGFLAGVSLALKLSGWSSTKVYGVEPEKGPTTYNALKAGKLVQTKLDTSCIAAGLMPPTAGSNGFKIIQKYVEDILLVSDNEIVNAMSTLYKIGLVTEPSGAAAFAALLANKVPDVQNKDVVVFLTGSNVSIDDLHHFVHDVCL